MRPSRVQEASMAGCCILCPSLRTCLPSLALGCSCWGWLLPGSYVVGLAVGFAALISAYAPQWAAEVLLGTTALCGGVVALARPLPGIVGCALAFTRGLALALDSPPGGVSVTEANV